MMTVMRNTIREGPECPYCNNNSDICMASFTSLKIGKLVKLKHCSSENYDNCALFLAKNLRSTR